jgi:uncharacterized protein (TIGR03435 family)
LKIATLFCGLVAIVGMLAVMLIVRSDRQRSSDWSEFGIAPASGRSASIGPGSIRADGLTLRAAIALAHDVPTVRVIGPTWLGHTRYAITVSVPRDAAPRFRTLLREELERLLNLRVHFELRSFDVLVLTTSGEGPAPSPRPDLHSAWIDDNSARIRSGTMGDVASVLQSVLGIPVVDETGRPGTYDLELTWQAGDRHGSVATLLPQKYGLVLTPAQRDLEALVIDSVRRDAALVVFAHIERLSRIAPDHVRRRIFRALTIH